MNRFRSIVVVSMVLLIVLPSSQAFGAEVDKQPPNVTIDTVFAPAPFNLASTFLAGLVNNVPGANVARLIEGKATDDFAGIKDVTGTWTACADPHFAGQACTAYPTELPQHEGSPVEVTCSNASNKSCVWESTLPLAPGFYEFKVSAKDKANKTSTVRAIRLWVVG